MTKKPVIYNIIPLILLTIACSFYFQVAFLLNLHILDFSKINNHITLSNWITMSLLTTTALCIYFGSRWAKLSMPITAFAVFWNNYLVGSYGENFSLTQTLFGAISFPLLFAPLYTKKNQKILSDKKQHWWNRAPRMHHLAPATVNPFISNAFNARTFDLSKSGVFIQIDEDQWAALPKIGERVNLSITLDTLRKFRCEAVIVRLEEPKGTYPRGIGLRFTELSHENKRTLNSFLDH